MRKSCVGIEVLILGYIPPETYKDAIENNISLTIFTYAQAEALEAAAIKMRKIAKVHLKVNTGMNRIGFDWCESGIEEAARIGSLTHLCINSVFTHCPTAGAANSAFIQAQSERLLSFVNGLRSYGVSVPVIHMANSSTTLQHPEYAYDTVRTALLIYGINPIVASGAALDIHPLMSIRAKIIQERQIEVGEGVSYDHLWVAKRLSRIGVVPMGYVDVPIRGIKNGTVITPGGRAPIIGTICMDQFMIDLTDTTAHVNDEITLLGKAYRDEITLSDLAKSCNVEDFRFLILISARLPRLYIRDKKIVNEKESVTPV